MGGYNPYADAVLDTAKGSMINIQDSSNRWLPSISIMGKSTQTKTNGYQLLERLYVGYSVTTNGITYTVKDQGKIEIQGTATETSQFFIMPHSSVLNLSGTYTVQTKGLTSDIRVWFKGWLNTDTTIQITYNNDNDNIYINITSGTTVNTTIQVMLEQGSTAHDYEAYTGKQPSPSIDYPQAITDTTSEEIEITDGTNTQTANFNLTLRGIPVSSGGNYTDNDGQQWVCDTIERYKDGTGKLVQRVTTKTFNGSENWIERTNGRVGVSYTTVESNTTTPTSLCTHFNLINNSAGVGYNDNAYVLTGAAIYCSPTINGSRLTLNEWKTFLETNNMTVHNLLITPIETPLTKEQLDALNLSTYYPTTTIVSSPDIEIEYVCDTKNYINRINNN